MSIEERQKEIVEEFAMLDNWMDKYEQIIEAGNALEPMEDQYKTQENMVKGCQSNVWLQADFRNGKIYFHADSDALITKGLIALLLRVFSGSSPGEIIHNDPHFISELGLKEHLSPNRANGLAAMMNKIKLYALEYQKKMS